MTARRRPRVTAKPKTLNLCPIEARANAATPGPWVQWIDQGQIFGGPVTTNEPGCMSGYRCEIASTEDARHDDEYEADEYSMRIADAEFIANARQDIPLLLAEVRRLRAEVKRLGGAS